MNSTDQNAKNEALKQALFPKEIEDNLYGNHLPKLDLKTIRLLLLLGAKLNQEEFAYIKDEKLLAVLKAVLKEEESLLFSAIKDGDQKFVELFLQLEGKNRKDKLNASDSQGNIVLHLAVKNDQENIVKLLMERLANPNMQDSQGNTALHLATKLGQEDIAYLLLQNTGTNPNTQDSQGNTVLHLIAEIGDSRNGVYIAYLLLQRTEINPNIKNSQGNTALHLAVKSNNMAIADLLLNEGDADLDIQDSQGNTALYYAVKNGNVDITKLFLRKCGTQRITILRNALSNFEQQEEDLYSPTHLDKQNILQLLLQYGVQYVDPQLVKLSIEFKVNLADFYQAKNSEGDFVFCEIIDHEDPQRLEMLKTLIEANFDLWKANRIKLVPYIKGREEDDSREAENIVNEFQNKNKEESLQYLDELLEKATRPQTTAGSPSSSENLQKQQSR